MRRIAVLFGVAFAAACAPTEVSVVWMCDFDATESRPSSDPDATSTLDADLPANVCQETCGTPVTHCTATVLEGGVQGAVCPVCTF